MPKRRVIKLGQEIELDDGCFIVVEHGKNVFRLRDVLTGDYRLMHSIELSKQLPAGRSLETEEEPTLAATIDEIEPRMLVLAPHIQKLIDGTPAVGDVSRPEYDTALPKSTRRARKLRELKELGFDKLADRTLRRYVHNFEEAGIFGLRDNRKGRKQNSAASIDDDLRKAILELIASYVGRSTVTHSALFAELEFKLLREYPDAKDRPKMPSVSSLKRYIRKLAGDQDPTKPAKRRETDALVPRHEFRNRLAAAPGDEVQVDSQRFDAYVKMPDGKVKRPQLTLLLDKSSRSFAAHAFTAGSARGYDHAVLVGRCVTPRRNRAWSNYYDEHKLPEMPWTKYLDDEELADYDAHRPYIIPRRIVADNDQTYRSKVLRGACDRFGINLTQAPVRQPLGKPNVERHFQTINTMFTQFLPGYVGPGTDKKGKKAAKEKALSLRDLDELFSRWTAIVWQNRAHDGLRDPDDDDARFSPNMMFAARMEISGHFTIPFDADDYIELMPAESRVVGNDGITFHKRTYDAPELIPLRKQKDANGNSVEVVVHHDPSDRSQVWVRAPEGRKWITCPRTDLRRELLPLETEVMERARELRLEWHSLTNRQANLAMLALREDVVREAAERDKKERADQAALAKAQAQADIPRITRRASKKGPEDEPFILAVSG